MAACTRGRKGRLMRRPAPLGQARRDGAESRAPRRLRIAVCTHTFLPTVGGAELGIHEIYRRIGQSHEVTILAPTPRGEAPPTVGRLA